MSLGKDKVHLPFLFLIWIRISYALKVASHLIFGGSEHVPRVPSGDGCRSGGFGPGSSAPEDKIGAQQRQGAALRGGQSTYFLVHTSAIWLVFISL